jgi:hypothetical protein
VAISGGKGGLDGSVANDQIAKNHVSIVFILLYQPRDIVCGDQFGFIAKVQWDVLFRFVIDRIF